MTDAERDEQNLRAVVAYVIFGSSRAAAKATYSSHPTVLKRVREYTKTHDIDQLRASLFHCVTVLATKQPTASHIS